MKLALTNVLSAALNTLVQSSPVTVQGVGTNVPVIVPVNVVVRKAGVVVATVSDGDSITIELTSASTYATPAHAVIDIGGQKSVFTVVTQSDPTLYVSPVFANKSPLEVTRYASGQSFIPNSASNVLKEYDAAGALITTTALTAPALNSIPTGEYKAVADFWNDRVLFVNQATNAVISSAQLPVGSRPAHGVQFAATPGQPNGSTWVTLYGRNEIVEIIDNVVVQTIAVGIHPVDISANDAGTEMFVANIGSNFVTHLKFAAGTWTQTQVAVGAAPNEVVLDVAGNAWVTCIGLDAVYRISPTDVVTSFAVSGGPRGMAVDAAGDLWVACANDSTLKKLSPATSTVQTFATALCPLDVVVHSDGTVYVSSFGESVVQHFSAAGLLLGHFAVGDFPYGLSMTRGGNIDVATMYVNTPRFVATRDQIPIGFGITSQLTTTVNAAITSNNVTVQGIDAPVTASVPAIYGATLFKNGVSVGTSTTVVAGDVLYFTFTTPNAYGIDIEVPLFIGSMFSSWTAHIPVQDIIVDQFTFVDSVNAPLNAARTSNSVIVTGIDPAAVVTLDVVGGTIKLNGVSTGLATAQVRLNDVFALETTTSSMYSDVQFVSATIGAITAQWGVSNIALPIHQYILSKDVGPYEPLLTGVTQKVGNLVRINLADYTQTKWTALNPTNLPPTPYDQYAPMALESQLLQFTSGPQTIAPRFIACAGNNSVYDTWKSEFLMLSGTPHEIVLANGNLYIAQANGMLAVFAPNASGNFVLQTEIALTGNLYAMAVDGSNNVWVADITTDTLHKIQGTTVVQTIHGVGGDILSMACSTTHLWTANSYDNTVSSINLITGAIEFTVPSLSVPSLVTIDSSGHVWVAHYGTTSVLELDPINGSVISTQVLPDSSAAFMYAEPGYLWVIENSYALSTIQNKLSTLAPPVIDFVPQLAAPVGTTIRSNLVTLSGLPRSTGVKIGLLPRFRLFVNNVRVPNDVFVTVNNGDTLQIEADVVTTYGTDMSVTLFNYQSSSVFNIRSEADPIPDQVFFSSMFDTVLRTVYTSNTVVIAGLTPGSTTLINVSDVDWSVVVNGTVWAKGARVPVQNGDVVAITGPAKGIFGLTRLYNLEYRANLNMPAVVFGTLQMTNRTLNGAIYEQYKHLNDAAKGGWMFGESMRSVLHAGRNFSVGAAARSMAVVANVFAAGVTKTTSVQTGYVWSRSSSPSIGTTVSQFSRARKITSSTVSTLNAFTEPAALAHNMIASQITQAAKLLYNGVGYKSAAFSRATMTGENAVPISVGRNAQHVPSSIPQAFALGVSASNEIYVQPLYGKGAVDGEQFISSAFGRTQNSAGAASHSAFVTSQGAAFVAIANQFARAVVQHRGVPPQPLVMRFSAALVEIQSIAGKGFSAPLIESAVRLFEVPHNSIKEVHIVGFNSARKSLGVVAGRSAMKFHTVWDYTTQESAPVEGAWATAAEAIAAGYAAGYAQVSAFPVGNGYYVWTTPHPIQNTGCGLQPLPNTFPVPDKWYVHGG